MAKEEVSWKSFVSDGQQGYLSSDALKHHVTTRGLFFRDPQILV